MQDELLLSHHNGVPGVGAALVADDDIGLGREKVDDLAFALVAPLGSEHAEGGHGCRNWRR